MPRLSNSLPKYRRHRASGQAVVTLNGRDYYLGPHGTKASRREYDRLIGEWLENNRHPIHVTPNSITIVELAARYLKFAAGYYRAHDPKNRTLPGVKCAIRYLLSRYETTLAVEFGPLALKALRQKMIDDGLARSYINDHIGRIVRMFRWAVGEQLTKPEVYQALTAIQGLRRGRTEARETELVMPVENPVIDATLLHLADVTADMVRVQLLTGCRPAELCIVRPCDLDRSADPWQYRPSHHKNEHRGRERRIFIGPQAQSILLRYLVRDAEAYCFRPCDSEAKRRAAVHLTRQTPLSYGNKPGSNRRRKPKHTPGGSYNVDAYRRAIHRACDKAFPAPGELARKSGETSKAWHARLTESQRAELARWQSDHRWSPNRLRHSAGTEIRRRFGLEAAGVVLGHASANVTQIYAERDYSLAARIAQQVG
jgi:integrase